MPETFEMLEHENKGLRARITAYKFDLATATERIAELEAALATSEKRNEALTDEIETLHSVANQNDAMLAQIAAAAEKAQSQDEQIGYFRFETGRLNTALKAEMQDKKELDEQVDRDGVEIDRLHDQSDRFETELRSANKQISEFILQRDQANRRITELEAALLGG